MSARRRAAVVAALLPVLPVALAGPALAGWGTTRTATTAVGTAGFVFPDGAAAPPAPVVEVLDDGTATLSWSGTVLTGDDARPMTGYLVTARSVDSGQQVAVGCRLEVAPVVTCAGVDASTAQTHVFAYRPVYRWWVGPASGHSEPAAAVETFTVEEQAPAEQQAPAEEPVSDAPEPVGPATQEPTAEPVAQEETAAAEEPVAAQEPAAAEEPVVLEPSTEAFSAEPVDTVLLAEPPQE